LTKLQHDLVSFGFKECQPKACRWGSGYRRGERGRSEMLMWKVDFSCAGCSGCGSRVAVGGGRGLAGGRNGLGVADEAAEAAGAPGGPNDREEEAGGQCDHARGEQERASPAEGYGEFEEENEGDRGDARDGDGKVVFKRSVEKSPAVNRDELGVWLFGAAVAAAEGAGARGLGEVVEAAADALAPGKAAASAGDGEKRPEGEQGGEREQRGGDGGGDVLGRGGVVAFERREGDVEEAEGTRGEKAEEEGDDGAGPRGAAERRVEKLFGARHGQQSFRSSMKS